MSLSEHWIAYDVKREIGPTILREEWRADMFRADERNRVEGPFVPAEQLRGAAEALEAIAEDRVPGVRTVQSVVQAYAQGVLSRIRGGQSRQVDPGEAGDG